MKFLIFIVAILLVVSSVESGFLLNRLRGRSVDSDNEEPEQGVFGAFDMIAGDLGLKNVFRDVQIKVLGATEQILDSSKDVFENIEDVSHNLRDEKDKRTSDLKKALLYLKTEARRRREDLEDEIEIEKEQEQEALEAAKKMKKESEKSVKEKRSTASTKKGPTSSLLKKKSSTKKRNTRSEEKHEPKTTSAKINKRVSRSIDKENLPETETKADVDDGMENSTQIPIVAMSLGNGFGRHTG